MAGILDLVDRRAFIASLGGAAAVAVMGHEERAEALEHYAENRLNELAAAQNNGGAGAQDRPFPTVAELDAQIETRSTRRGMGNIFGSGRGNVRRLEKMPEKPTILDFFRLRFQPANHVPAERDARDEDGYEEEVILACLLHDVALNLMHVDHGWWGAQMFEPDVPEKTSFAIRYHQTLRFYADEEAGYEYPDSYHRTFGVDYVPPPHIQSAYKMLRNHKWYMEPRLVTVNDLYSFDPNAVVTIDPFIDIVGRHFKQPKEGLGNDNSPVAHMWRTLANPDAPL
jgi:hypothetical protein